MTDTFPVLRLSGTAEERGAAHGASLSESIAASVCLYDAILRVPGREIRSLGRAVREQIYRFYPPYCTEIDALADAAGQRPEWIYVLNARSEVVNGCVQSEIPLMECSTVSFRDQGLLGQNWDTGKALLDLVVLMHITLANGRRLLMITEPGVVGKTGLNNCGLGICLNLLHLKHRLQGVPLAVLARAVLESESIDQARELVVTTPGTRAACITVSQGVNQGFCIEFSGDKHWFLSSPGRISIHTNHYLGRRLTPDSGLFQGSYGRLRTLAALTSILPRRDISSLQRLLSSRAHSGWPVHIPWSVSPLPGVGEAGTLATMVMDLSSCVMHIRKGNDPQARFFSYSVELGECL
ncbi:MAG: C45 family autoproteolytic acyltransferase/hydrolase [Kistimonas sp.]|nr:C45 family autoproteolytic acyltransferase/hydrolase [Kistimonas sp.]